MIRPLRKPGDLPPGAVIIVAGIMSEERLVVYGDINEKFPPLELQKRIRE
jgi:hypothetical protein